MLPYSVGLEHLKGLLRHPCFTVFSRLHVHPKSGSQMFVLRVKILSAQVRHWRNSIKEIYYRERSNIKAPLTGSAPRTYRSTEQKGVRIVRSCDRQPKSTCRIFIFGLLKSIIEVRQVSPEFLTTNLDQHILLHSRQFGIEIFSLCTIFAQCAGSLSRLSNSTP